MHISKIWISAVVLTAGYVIGTGSAGAYPGPTGPGVVLQNMQSRPATVQLARQGADDPAGDDNGVDAVRGANDVGDDHGVDAAGTPSTSAADDHGHDGTPGHMGHGRGHGHAHGNHGGGEHGSRHG